MLLQSANDSPGIPFQPSPHHLRLGDFPGLCTFHFTFCWKLYTAYTHLRYTSGGVFIQQMATSEENAPLVTGSLAGSTEYGALVPPETTRGVSNRRAFKIAGLTTLACLLVASQVFTAYLLFDQNQQIHSLQSDSEDMRRELKNTRTRTVQMRMPMMDSMPLLMDFTMEPTPIPKLEDTAATVSVEEQVKNLLQQNSQLPQFNETFLANLQSLKEQIEKIEWKGFESWMRHWLIFQMAQQAPAPPTQKRDYDYEVKDDYE